MRARRAARDHAGVDNAAIKDWPITALLLQLPLYGTDVEVQTRCTRSGNYIAEYGGIDTVLDPSSIYSAVSVLADVHSEYRMLSPPRIHGAALVAAVHCEDRRITDWVLG